MATKEQTLATERRTKTILSVVLAIICVIPFPTSKASSASTTSSRA